MKKLIYLLMPFMILSCNNSKKKSLDTNTDVKTTETKAIYSLDTSGTIIDWTAYKFTEKVGVKGRFDNVILSPKTKSGSIENILLDSKVTINTMSVNSGNDIRDPKLKESFFKVFHTDTIKGQILKVDQNNGILSLKMNNISKDIPFKYMVKTDTIFIDTTINLTDWKGEEAMNSLNKECYDLHKGTDGISKLWPDVSVNIKLPVNKQ
jgi:polyisoprenoid-binding protein YceI